MSIVSFFKSSARVSDWTNQELAEFYRVEASLIRAGLPLDSDRGLSDEGEPWFIFVNRDTDQVIIHFARIDGVYVVASGGFESTLRGGDFRSLVESLVDAYPVMMPKPLGQKAKVVIHPAALLVALVFTCFLKTSEAEASSDSAAAPAGEASGLTDASEPGGGSVVILHDERLAALFVGAIAFAVAIGAQLAGDGPKLADLPEIEYQASPTLISSLSSEEHNLNYDLAQDGSGQSFLITQHSLIEDADVVKTEVYEKPPLVVISQSDAPIAPTFDIGQLLPAHDSFGVDAPDPVFTSFMTSDADALGAATSQHAAITLLALQLLERVLGDQAWSFVNEGLDTEDIIYLSNLVEQTQNTATLLGELAEVAVAANLANLNKDPYEKLLSFMNKYPNYEIMMLDKTIVVYHPNVNANSPNARVDGLEFNDGSIIVLIGLADSHFSFA